MSTRILVTVILSFFLLAACAPARQEARVTPAASTLKADELAKKTTPAQPRPAAAPTSVPARPPAAPSEAARAAGSVGDRAPGAFAPPGGPAVAVPPAAGAAQNAAPPSGAAPQSAPEPAIKPTGTDANALPQIQPLNRMVIYTTDITLLVKSVAETVRAIGDIAAVQGGYIAGVENGSEGGVPVSTVRIKVLPDRYQATMNQLRGLAVEVAAEKATTQDVTEEYNDVQTQLASLEASHRQLLELLSRATTVEEILKIQTQANQIKLQIDRLRGRATALERLSDLATIAIRVQSAEVALGKEYTVVRGQLRQAESQYAAQLLALKRARTPEEEAAIRDKLGELALQIERASGRVREIEQKATEFAISLPRALPEDPNQISAEKDLPQQFIDARVKLRQTEALQAQLTRRLKEKLSPEEQTALRAQLSEAILELSRVNLQLKTIQERATQTGVVLPQLTPEQEAVLAGTAVEATQPDLLRAIGAAWDASLILLRNVLAGLLTAIVFLWWVIPLVGLLVYLVARRVSLRGVNLGRRRPAAAAVEGPGPTT
jgi:hypothetical protein